MSHVNYRDILRHHANGRSQSQIAQACGCARSTVQDVLKLSREKGISWNDVAPLTEKGAYELIRGKPRDVSEGYEPIDYDYIERELSRDRTMTLTILWEEYCMRAVHKNTRPYGYSRFCELYSCWCDKHDIAITKRYIAGDLGEFDWVISVNTDITHYRESSVIGKTLRKCHLISDNSSNNADNSNNGIVSFGSQKGVRDECHRTV